MHRRLSSVATLLALLPAPATFGAPPPVVVEYPGCCNASAAVSLGDGRFVVADDEDNPTTFLRVYRNGQAEEPLAAPLSTERLQLDTSESLEVDIEGAARIDDRIYWIGSHSANKKGKEAKNRRRLFATTVTATTSSVTADVVGAPYRHLVRDLDNHPGYARFHLKDAGKVAPKLPGGLSIEGLAATPEGDLLIGFRNPIPDGKALIARLKNPKGVTEEKDAKFGPPILLKLDGLGIRSLEWAPALNQYTIVGGHFDGESGSRLYLWSGADDSPKPVPGVDLTSLNPEAIFLDGRVATILSDDGRREIAGQTRDCAAPDVKKTFRGLRITLERP